MSEIILFGVHPRQIYCQMIRFLSYLLFTPGRKTGQYRCPARVNMALSLTDQLNWPIQVLRSS